MSLYAILVLMAYSYKSSFETLVNAGIINLIFLSEIKAERTAWTAELS